MDLVAGVFLGVAANDFAEVVRTTPSLARSVYAATGSSHSVASGRISFVLGMQGPCVSYDTACSAALAANHAALRALQHRECVAALSVGVSMMLLPGVGITFATAGMLSAGGHCHTFDSRADGYVRGEACCAATLRVSSFAAHDTLRVVGSCVRQDGKSASLTAPNGQAQRALLWAALADAAMLSDQVACVEAHGTGTALGDPIEARSLASLLTERRNNEALAVGSVKANGGHAEPAAGITGLLRLAVGVRDRVAPPNSQLRAVNPHVVEAFDGISCTLPTQLSAAPACYAQASGLCAGGVSSFGYSGTIVHAVLQSSPHSVRLPTDRPTLAYRRVRYPMPHRAAAPPQKPRETEVLFSFDFAWTEAAPVLEESTEAVEWLLLSMDRELDPCSDAPWRAVPGLRDLSDASAALAPAHERPVGQVAMLMPSGPHEASAEPSMPAMRVLLAVVQEVIKMKPMPSFVCLTRGSQVVRAQEQQGVMAGAAVGGAWGFLRCVQLEHVNATWAIRDSPEALTSKEAAKMLLGAAEREMALGRSGSWYAPRLVRKGAIGALSADARLGGAANLITGGLGGLGLRAAVALAAQGASHVVLASRSGRVARGGQGLEAQLQSLRSHCVVEVYACDVGRQDESTALLSHSQASAPRSLRVIHTAGVLQDGLTRKMTYGQLAAVFGPKAQGAAILHYTTRNLDCSAFITFSSIASAYGNVGQANYGAANSYLDVLVTLRRAGGLRGCSLQLPPVSGAGMGAELVSKFAGKEEIWTVPLDTYAKWLIESLAMCASGLRTILSSRSPGLPASARLLLADDEFGKVSSSESEAPPVAGQALAMSTEEIQAILLKEVKELTNIDGLDADTPLMEAGVDSMAALELRNRVEEVIGIRMRNEDLLADAEELTVAMLTSAIERHASAAPGDGKKEGGQGEGAANIDFLATSVVFGTAAPVPTKLSLPILFVFSSPRSGSSLLQLCLQANPMLYAGQELYLLMFDTMAERAAMPEMRYVDEGLVKTVMELLSVSAAEARARIKRFGPDCPTWRVYQALQRMCGSRILVDKTPANASHVNFMHRAHETFAAASYIHLIRHPYACISSGLQMFRDFLDISHTTWGMVEQSWVDTNRACDDFMAAYREAAGTTSSMRLRYEDFLRDPATCTRAICEDLLGIRWEEGMANPYETSAVKSFEAAESKSTTDQKLLKRKTIEPRQAEKWREVQLPQPLLDTTKELAATHGYELLPDVQPELTWLAQPTGEANGGPVVCIHDFTGLLWGFRSLSPILSPNGCLGIRGSTRLLDGCETIQQLAVAYVQLLPKGLWKGGAPVRLVGYSLGCRVAYWMACLLEAEGRPVELVLLDGPVRGDAGYPGRMGGFASQVADDIRAKMNLPPREEGAAKATDSGSEPSAAAKMQFSVMKRSGSFRMLFSLLEDAGEDAAAAAVRLIELPDVGEGSLREFEGPVLFAHTEQIRENGTADVVLQRVAHATVHKVPGDHFSFITKHAAQVAELLAGWPASQVPEIPPTPAFEPSPTPVRGGAGSRP
mmetsp:Transcript_43931/g.145497  ORF Transcript_43931/g.145497 Transcript_43931/m.145497 type:complete len:1528 (+) Transcript_43931:2-4585(+)